MNQSDLFKLDFYLIIFCLVIIFSSDFAARDIWELYNAKITLLSYEIKIKVLTSAGEENGGANKVFFGKDKDKGNLNNQ